MWRLLYLCLNITDNQNKQTDVTSLIDLMNFVKNLT